jgi:hypothetical protein
LLERLQDVPDRIQVIDDIDYAPDQAPADSGEAPNAAASPKPSR